MSFELSFNWLKDTLPQLLVASFSALIQEQFTKLHRLIEAYEVSIGLVSAAIVQSFYSLGLAKKFPTVDANIRVNLNRPAN